MARKKIQKNISYDEERRLYYVTLNFGKDASGKYIKKYKTATRLPDARKILKKHEADKTNDQLVMPTKITFHDYSE